MGYDRKPWWPLLLAPVAAIIILLGLTTGPENIKTFVTQLSGGSHPNTTSSSHDETPPSPYSSSGKESEVNENGGQYCKWVFDYYQSSEYEEAWFGRIKEAQKDICNVVAEPEHNNASHIIVSRAIELTSVPESQTWKTVDTFEPTAANSSDEYMSRMYYKRECYDFKSKSFKRAPGKGVQIIEPLWGMLRDPFDQWCEGAKLIMPGKEDEQGQSKAHIIPQGFAPYTYNLSDEEPGADAKWRSHGLPPWHSSLRPFSDPQLGVAFQPPQNIHLDLGSSYFSTWKSGAGNLAASGEWFYNHYHKRGPAFDRFIGVEVEVLDDTFAYEQVPTDLVGKYNLMNVGLTMDDDDRLNTVDMIKRIVNPEDFFVFKLDIDSAPIEEPIVENLLADDPNDGGASALIDELMFEHHVDYDPMNGPWNHPKGVGDLARSYNVFRDLRKKGIRSHSWP